MQTTVLVIGTGRSGTSLVAGICHKLGVHMGDQFVPSDANNKAGTFEELEFCTLGDGADYEAYAEKRKSQGNEFWGIKDPQLIGRKKIYHLIPHLDNIKIILARRPGKAAVASFIRAYDSNIKEATDWHEVLIRNLDEFMKKYPGTVLIVDFDDIISKPELVTEQIADYVFGEDHGKDVSDAASHTDLSLRHFMSDGKYVHSPSAIKHDGWGQIAIGARVAKHPEPMFFNDWTALITSGVRTGDTILMPKMHMPAHYASNALARDFLKTDKDALLMVDDDMTFPPSSLERLRTHGDNWDYDIVSGFTTTRVWPPLPIVMKRIPAPELPYSKWGATYVRERPLHQDAVIQVDAVGLAFTLIRRHVLEAMIDRDYGPSFTFWFDAFSREGLFREIVGGPDLDLSHTSFFSYGEGKESDDIPFSRRCRELGFRLAVDYGVKIGHIGHVPLGWHDYKVWLETQDEQD